MRTRRSTWRLFGAAAAGILATVLASGMGPLPPQEKGSAQRPMLPGGRWRVHDEARPQPRVVSPAPAGASTPPPGDAVVLFDGKSLAQWTGREGKARWKLGEGWMEVNGTGDIQTRLEFGDVQLHLEWRAPLPPAGSGQGRGNSGVFLMGRYEIQVLDSFGNRTYPDGQAAALYGQCPPLVNACRPPGEWQTYDVFFKAPKWDEKALKTPGVVTLLHNGVLVHHAAAFIGSTVHGRVATYERHAATGPLKLQDHGNPVRYRNIWVRPLAGHDR